LVLLLVVVFPVAAITWGEPDDGEHPYVGFMIFQAPSDGGWYSCSGTLLDADTLLTAGHCTYGIGNNVWVTFKETDVLAGIDWFSDETIKFSLETSPDYVRGTAIPHPEYANFAGFPNTRDVGVVELWEANTEITTYGQLPSLRQFDYLNTSKGAARDRRFVVVGYGYQALVPPPYIRADDSRFKGQTTLTNTRSAYTSGYNFQFTNSPGVGNGSGGVCFGDSGGPALWQDTNIVAAITSFGITPYCTGLDFSYRADIAETLIFVSEYLE
jgi:hypothetical protein